MTHPQPDRAIALYGTEQPDVVWRAHWTSDRAERLSPFRGVRRPLPTSLWIRELVE